MNINSVNLMSILKTEMKDKSENLVIDEDKNTTIFQVKLFSFIF